MFSWVLLVYHIFLINQNITTNEKLKSTYGRQGQNPHNKGCFANWTTFFNNSFSVRKSYVIQSSRNTFYRLKVDDPSGVKEEETNDLLGDDSNARLSAMSKTDTVETPVSQKYFYTHGLLHMHMYSRMYIYL